ncbi:MAG: hypothetical protein AAF557_23965 [Pseudomonadota bacterium]
MRGHSVFIGAALLCAGCAADPADQQAGALDPGTPEPGGVGLTIPLGLDSDLTRQKVAKAICTRGNSYAQISVDPEGRIAGTLTDTERPVSGTMIARDAKTVELTVDQGTVRDETVGEAMQITTDGTRVFLTGSTFVCRGVQVRSAE